MNLAKRLGATALCALLLGFFSCENHTVLPSEPAPGPAPVSGAPEASDIPVAKKYLLTEFSSYKLTYNRESKITKISTGNQYFQVEYGNGWTAVTLFSDQVKSYKEVFDLNAKGLSHQARVYKFNDPGALPQLIETRNYHYDGAGKLVQMTYKDVPNKRVQIYYDANGDLSREEWYNAQNFKTLEFTYAYELPGKPRKTDRIPTDYAYSFAGDGIFVPLFGVTHKHLVQRRTLKSFWTNSIHHDEIFAYTLNADGFPESYKVFDVLDNIWRQDPVLYKYSIN
ncbi:DUF4595 domain-containing protein [Larkinella soli]|uniref:DUF4595 domain-containing protein n=1 Tax=Larkinella soli TaxID=1770527 RepID=UPI000FFBC892|nr:DUF4595 domain-containing protein [Larkinella soli]